MQRKNIDWLKRLEGVRPFFPLPDAPAVGSISLGGLSAGAVPAAVRASHGYARQFPADDPPELTARRRGEFFRN